MRGLILLLALAAINAVAEPTAFQWPGDYRAAVSLAYDDALDSQLDVALPALNQRGLKASFYLPLDRASVHQRLADWRAAAAAGHELGNHSLFHQCSASLPGRDWVRPEHDLDRISASQMAAQVRLANSFLHAIDGKRRRTFTAPCGDRLAGGQDYLVLVRSEFVAIKVSGAALTGDRRQLDLYAVSAQAPVAASGAELIALVESAVAVGGLVNITFHGVGGDYLSVSAEAHDQLLDYLAANRARIWTDSFVVIADYLQQRQSK